MDDAQTPPPAPAAAPARPDLEQRILAAILGWRDRHIAGGPIGRAVECWNHLDEALTHLVADIAKEL
jgi:hypothetical protein